ncbi:hypothetical protein RR48_08614 [Papilio machaon]|uniref:Uncharacterized protein n=1 Tax=Papilio machaon TaxID=76193 RepID=A0A194RHX2_PAPMA|nr:hypothetical protein RR48_08614 [Papilio machaon]
MNSPGKSVTLNLFTSIIDIRYRDLVNRSSTKLSLQLVPNVNPHLRLRLWSGRHLSELCNDRLSALDKKIYDIPCEISRPNTPDFKKSTKIDFRKLRQNFEVGFSDTETEVNKRMSKDSIYQGRGCINEAKKIFDNDKNYIPKEPLLTKKVSKSTDNVCEEFKTAKKTIEKQFNTDTRRYRKFEKGEIKSVTRLSLAKKDNTQLDVDRENVSMAFKNRTK